MEYPEELKKKRFDELEKYKPKAGNYKFISIESIEDEFFIETFSAFYGCQTRFWCQISEKKLLDWLLEREEFRKDK